MKKFFLPIFLISFLPSGWTTPEPKPAPRSKLAVEDLDTAGELEQEAQIAIAHQKEEFQSADRSVVLIVPELEVSSTEPSSSISELIESIKQNRRDKKRALKLIEEFDQKNSTQSIYRTNARDINEIYFQLELIEQESRQLYKKVARSSCEIILNPVKKSWKVFYDFFCPGFFPFC